MRKKTKRNFKQIRKICHVHEAEINSVISNLLLNYDKRINPCLIKGYVTDGYRGRAYCKENMFSVPLWAYNRGLDYFTYYTAHEISHIISWRRYKNNIHDAKFYEIFKELCPKDVQHFELHYKKQANVRYGVWGK